MSDFIDISMVGDKELTKQLKKLDFKLQKKIVRQSISKAMLPVRNAAIANAPVDSGKLKASIKRKNKTKRGVSRSSIVTGTRSELGIKTKGYYPAAIEYGYKKKNGEHVPAKSFMRKAISDNQTSVLNNVGKFIGNGIKKANK